MDLYLSGKTAIVTGASTQGCGQAIARALAREGVAVAITARRVEALRKLAAEIKAEGCIEPVVLPADLYDPETPERLAADARRLLGRVDIVAYARREYNLLLGERTAEDIKISISSAAPGEWDAQRVTLRGRDLLTGLPRSVEVGGEQIREAIEPSIALIVETVKGTIEETPPELIADIMDQGIVLAGGGALLQGLDQRIAEATQMPVHIADDPLTCVARGTGSVLEELDRMKRVLVADTYARAPR